MASLAGLTDLSEEQGPVSAAAGVGGLAGWHRSGAELFRAALAHQPRDGAAELARRSDPGPLVSYN